MTDRREGLGQELQRVHDRLRVRLSAIQSALDDVADPTSFEGSCLAFCRGLRRHHLGEDKGAFAVLRRRDPTLGDALDALSRDHAFLDPMLDRLEALVAPAGDHPDRSAVEREVAGIAAVLENHLAYEERVLVGMLDSLQAAQGSPDERALRAPLEQIG